MATTEDSGMKATPAQGSVVRQTELIVSGVLRGGVVVSAAVILLGIADFYIRRLTGQLSSGFSQLHSLSGVWSALLQGQPLAIVALGLVILLATPVLRVAISILAFAVERDRAYVLITLLVLIILLFSIFVVGSGSQATLYNLHNSSLLFFFEMLLSSVAAGLIGALVGLGGGVFIVPILTLIFHVPFGIAIGASIVSVIATSSGAAAAYVRDHMTNLRVGMFLEIATTLGAICGALLSAVLNASVLFIVFGVVLMISALPLVAKLGEELPQGVKDDRFAQRLRLASTYPDHRMHREVPYQVSHVPAGFGMMYVAGLISGLLGIGSGTFKVLAMDTAMRLPMKVSTTTSNFMIGVTAAASAGIYFQRGDIDPLIAAPVALGVLIGATVGAVTLTGLSNVWVKRIFVPIIVLVALNMLLRGLGLLG